jgi:hypothetical protein
MPVNAKYSSVHNRRLTMYRAHDINTKALLLLNVCSVLKDKILWL